MKVEIEQSEYEALKARAQLVDDFIERIDGAANEGYDEENDADWVGNPDFDSEMIGEIAISHFNLYDRF